MVPQVFEPSLVEPAHEGAKDPIDVHHGEILLDLKFAGKQQGGSGVSSMRGKEALRLARVCWMSSESISMMWSRQSIWQYIPSSKGKPQCLSCVNVRCHTENF